MSDVFDITARMPQRVGIEQLTDEQRAVFALYPEVIAAIVTRCAADWGILLNASQRDAMVVELQRKAATA